MAKRIRKSLTKALDDLLIEFSMPEIIEALQKLCRENKLDLKRQRNSEYQGWAVIEDALMEARVRIGDLD